jgi:ADP-ribose pyrophosphatase YjhB (NUDIX family)
MSLEVHVHTAQTSILRELLFQRSAGFAELQKPTGLDSDHFNFHIAQLVKKGLVERQARGRYALTPVGKEYANKLDTDSNTIERQPKISVLLVIWRSTERKELLLQERLKNPYFGFWGYPTGKVRWGEMVVEAAARELLEETGLIATFRFKGIYHEHAYREGDRDMLEDKLFLITETCSTTGALRDAEGCHNQWVKLAAARTFEKCFPGFATVQAIVAGRELITELTQNYPTDHF